jgi:YaiO family outer membrane protein
MNSLSNFHKRKRESVLLFTLSTLTLLSAQETGQCGTKAVDALIQQDKLHQAYRLSQNLYARCHDKTLGRLEAKLAFWNGDIDKAYSLLGLFQPKEKLYRQIYAAKVLKDIKGGKYPAIPPFLENDYDILAARIEQKIRQHRFEEAYRLSRRLYSLYHTREGLELQANLLFWMKRYSQSLQLFKRLGDRKKIKQVRGAMMEEKLARVDREIGQEWRNSNKLKARELFESLSPEEQEYYRSHYRDNACRVESTRMVGMGFDHVTYSDHRYRDHTNYLEFTLPIERFTVYGKIEDTHRYGLHDTKFTAEIYPPAYKGFWGYLTFSVTPNADFYSRYSIGAYLYKDIGNEEFGIGYLYSHYATLDSHLIDIEYRHYFNAYLSIRGIYYYEFTSHSYAGGVEIDYETPCHVKIKASYLYSSAKEQLSDYRILDERGHNFMLEAEYPLTRSLSLGGRLLWQRSIGAHHYSSRGISLYLRHYW